MDSVSAILEWLRKEIDMMREILGNMLQEEISLLQHDKEGWTKLMMHRAELYGKLCEARDKRLEATRQAFPQEKELPFEKLLAIGDANSCDILVLRDQMIALIEKLNTQSSRNELLSKISQQGPGQEARPQPQPEKKGKISIATIPPEQQ